MAVRILKNKCVWCDIAAWMAIAAGVIVLLAVLPGWVYLLLIAAALILGGLYWLGR